MCLAACSRASTSAVLGSSQSAAPAAGFVQRDGASAAFRLAHRIHHVAGEGGAARVVVLLLDEDGLVEDVADQGVDESRDRRMHALAGHDAARRLTLSRISRSTPRCRSDKPDAIAVGAGPEASRMFVAEARRPRPLDARQDLIAHRGGVVETLQDADVGAERRAGLALVVAVRRAAAARRLDDHVGDAEVALQRPLRDLDVLDVLEADGGLVDGSGCRA